MYGCVSADNVAILENGQYRSVRLAGEEPRLLIEVDARLEDDQLRLTCQRLTSLDQEAARAAAGLKIHIRDEAPLADLRSLIGGEAKGRNRIAIVSHLATGEVEIGLRETIALSPKFMGALRSVAGVAGVEEI